MSERDEGEETFASFKGLGYVSMVRGVPLGPLLILFAAAVAGGWLLAALVSGLLAILWVLICAACLLGLKVVCESDNKAMERATWDFRAWKLRLRKSSIVLTVSPNKARTEYERFFRQLKKIHRS